MIMTRILFLNFLKKDNRHNVIYARVSTSKQNADLKRQVKSLVDYCDSNKILYETIH